MTHIGRALYRASSELWAVHHLSHRLLFALTILLLPAVFEHHTLAAPPFFSRVRPDPDKEKSPGTLVVGKDGYQARSPAERKKSVRKAGGNAQSEKSVEDALNWLARHQNQDGSWSFSYTPGDKCSDFADPGSAQTKMGATGLGLLPFLGAGYTHQQESDYQETVVKALHYLEKNMQVSGALYDTMNHETMYSHGIAGCAVAEAYGMTLDQELKDSAQRAIDFISASQDKDLGGWRYTPGKESDTSVVGWQVMALKSGKISELKVPQQTLDGVTRWLNHVQSDFAPDYNSIGASYGYTSALSASGATTAIGLLCRNYLGTPKTDPGLRRGVSNLSMMGPDPDNMYYNYYATMVLFQNNGPAGKLWKAWNERMRDQLIATQVQVGKDRGSWQFADSWSDRGGRVYNTALSAMTLEIYYRYLPIYETR
jgi:hypothetical protein